MQDEYGVPPEISKIVLDAVTKYANKATDNLGFNIPKGSGDVNNKELEFIIKAKRKAVGDSQAKG